MLRSAQARRLSYKHARPPEGRMLRSAQARRLSCQHARPPEGRIVGGGGMTLLFKSPRNVEPSLRGRTVHVVGRLTPSVFSFLYPATQSIGATGAPQTVIAIDDSVGREYLRELRPDVAVISVPDQASPWARSRALYHHLAEVARCARIAALHLHGILPGVA